MKNFKWAKFIIPSDSFFTSLHSNQHLKAHFSFAHFRMGIIKVILNLFCCCCESCDDDYSVSSSAAGIAYANEYFRAGSNSGPPSDYSGWEELGHGSYNKKPTPMAPNDFSLSWEGKGDPFFKSEYDKTSAAGFQCSVAGRQCSNGRITTSFSDHTGPSTWNTLDRRFMGVSFRSRVRPN